MLEGLGLRFFLRPQHIDESALTTEDPTSYVLRLAAAKARSAMAEWRESEKTPRDAVFLGADTVVVQDGHLLGKPETRAEAQKTIERLGGRSHRVITGFWLEGGCGGNHHGTVETEVSFRPLLPREIEDYLDTGEWSDKAGGYGIQGAAAFMVDEIHGSYTNVVGLPLAQVTRALCEMGAVTHLVKNMES